MGVTGSIFEPHTPWLTAHKGRILRKISLKIKKDLPVGILLTNAPVFAYGLAEKLCQIFYFDLFFIKRIDW